MPRTLHVLGQLQGAAFPRPCSGLISARGGRKSPEHTLCLDPSIAPCPAKAPVPSVACTPLLVPLTPGSVAGAVLADLCLTRPPTATPFAFSAFPRWSCIASSWVKAPTVVRFPVGPWCRHSHQDSGLCPLPTSPLVPPHTTTYGLPAVLPAAPAPLLILPVCLESDSRPGPSVKLQLACDLHRSPSKMLSLIWGPADPST